MFFALFGIPLGRLADVWDRRKLIALGLALWSLMTALSGFARSFAQLAIARIGVGIGEASAAPAAFSLLSDYFPPARRATVLAIYSSGIYIGAGLGLAVGGLVVEALGCRVSGRGAVRPARLAGRVLRRRPAGLLLALWVRTLREPVRGASEAIEVAHQQAPLRAFGRELRAVLPPLTLLHLWLSAGAAAVARNLLAAALIAGGVALLIVTPATRRNGSRSASASMPLLRGCRRSPFATPRHGATHADAVAASRRPRLRPAGVRGIRPGVWLPPVFMRVHGAPPGRAGMIVGLISAGAGGSE